MRPLAALLLLVAGPAAADRLIAPSDLAPRGTVSAEVGASYSRATVDLAMDDPFLHTVGMSLRARVAPWDGVLVGVAQGFVVDRRVEVYDDVVKLDDPTGVGDLAFTAEGILPLGPWKLGAQLALWVPTGTDDLSSGAAAIDVDLVAALRVTRRVELFFTAGHKAADRPDRIELVGGMHARDDNWSFAPRLRVAFDSPVDDVDRGAVAYGVELWAAIEFIPDVSFVLVAGLTRDRVLAEEQYYTTRTLNVAGILQGTHDFF